MLKLKPGILVALRTTIRGGISYQREDLDHEIRPDNSEEKTWKTVRHTADRDEADRATVTRAEVRRIVSQQCTQTPWGLVSYVDEENLNAGIEEAYRVADEFNNSAKHSHLLVSVFCGRVAQDDVEAIQAVRREVQAVLAEVQGAIEQGDVKSMRDLAMRARQMTNLLNDEAEEKETLNDAVKAIRLIARDVVKHVEKQGEDLETILTEKALAPVATARFTFTREEA